MSLPSAASGRTAILVMGADEPKWRAGAVRSAVEATFENNSTVIVKMWNESGKTGAIVPQIIEDILDASIVVADLGDDNRNVYFELGVTQTLGIPTVLLLPEDEQSPPFDISDQYIVRYKTVGEKLSNTDTLHVNIRDQVEKIREGSRPSNPVVVTLAWRSREKFADRIRESYDLESELRLQGLPDKTMRQDSPTYMELARRGHLVRFGFDNARAGTTVVHQTYGLGSIKWSERDDNGLIRIFVEYRSGRDEVYRSVDDVTLHIPELRDIEGWR